MGDFDARDKLVEQIDNLSPVGVSFVSRLVESVANQPATDTTPHTWLTASSEFVEYFGYVISAHHGVTTQPLGLVNFEVGFRNACKAANWKPSDSASATQRFVDLMLTGPTSPAPQKLSLKSTAASRLSKTTLHISKLTEAAWIQDMRSATARRDRTLELFREYRTAVDSILMLRAFRRGSGIPSMYQLVEIPTAVFDSLHDEPIGSFAADGPTIDCTHGGVTPAARVLLDRSDAKITIKQIAIEVCTVHAEWHLAAAE